MPLFENIPLLKHLHQPIDKSINHRCRNAVDDDRSCDCEHLRADTEDETFGFEFDGSGRNSIGEAGDGHQSACACVFGDIIIKAEAGQ